MVSFSSPRRTFSLDGKKSHPSACQCVGVSPVACVSLRFSRRPFISADPRSPCDWDGRGKEHLHIPTTLGFRVTCKKGVYLMVMVGNILYPHLNIRGGCQPIQKCIVGVWSVFKLTACLFLSTNTQTFSRTHARTHTHAHAHTDTHTHTHSFTDR